MRPIARCAFLSFSSLVQVKYHGEHNHDNNLVSSPEEVRPQTETGTVAERGAATCNDDPQHGTVTRRLRVEYDDGEIEENMPLDSDVTLLPARARPDPRPSATTVSYTHLTLPTICSV